MFVRHCDDVFVFLLDEVALLCFAIFSFCPGNSVTAFGKLNRVNVVDVGRFFLWKKCVSMDAVDDCTMIM